MNLKQLASFLAFMAFAFLAVGSKEQTAEEKCTDKIHAFVMSQEFVKKRLKAPSSAEFPYISSEGVSVIYLGECKHNISAYVDAQNSFGAKIRTRYSAQIQYDKGTDKWWLLAIEFQ